MKIAMTLVLSLFLTNCTVPKMDMKIPFMDYPEEKKVSKTKKKKIYRNKVKKVKKKWAGQYDTVPKNAFDHLDYSQTKLDKGKALHLLNNYRRQNGLRIVTLDARLNKAALRHAKDLAKHDRISHHGSDGSEPDKRISDAGYKWSFSAENVATGQNSFEETLQGWKESPGHNANLLAKDAAHVGFALVVNRKTGYKTFWVMTIAS